MRCVLPRVCCHETCTLHDTSKHGPGKHVTGMHCSIVMVPREITHVKMKLQLSGTVCGIVVVHNTHSKMNTYLLYKYIPPLHPPFHIHCPATSTLIHFAIFLWESICLQRPNYICKTHRYHRRTACNH